MRGNDNRSRAALGALSLSGPASTEVPLVVDALLGLCRWQAVSRGLKALPKEASLGGILPLHRSLAFFVCLFYQNCENGSISQASFTRIKLTNGTEV